MKTIAAISTSNASSAIAMLRLSGDSAAEIASAVFSHSGGKSLTEFLGYQAAYGNFICDGEVIDDGVCIVYKAPKSYTGEDMVELCCHGNTVITSRLMAALIKNGACVAGAGEFTKRAFLNGKMDLSQAEAVAELISSEGEAACRQALLRREGKLGKEVDNITKGLLKILSAMGAWADYPEEDEIPFVTNSEIEECLKTSIANLEKLSIGYTSGRLIDKGIRVAVVGSPNVGKSTLSNILWEKERSIVTDVAGTTRDVVEGDVSIEGIKIKLLDTAGIRETVDKVESIGVERSKKAFMSADLVIMVVDSSRKMLKDEQELLKEISALPSIVVFNKADIKTQGSENEGILISAKTGQGIDCLKKEILNKLNINLSQDTALIASERQFQCISRGLNSAKIALEAVVSGVTLDAVSVLIDDTVEPLLELTGKSVTTAVTEEIFKNFCVGK